MRFAFQILLVLWCKLFLLRSPLFLHSVHQAQIANGSLDHGPILLQSPICECQQILKRLQSESSAAVLVVVVMVLHHMLRMQLDILEFFQSPSVISVHVVRSTGHLFEPHCLIVMDAHIISTILDENVHNFCAQLQLAIF